MENSYEKIFERHPMTTKQGAAFSDILNAPITIKNGLLDFSQINKKLREYDLQPFAIDKITQGLTFQGLVDQVYQMVEYVNKVVRLL